MLRSAAGSDSGRSAGAAAPPVRLPPCGCGCGGAAAAAPPAAVLPLSAAQSAVGRDSIADSTPQGVSCSGTPAATSLPVTPCPDTWQGPAAAGAGPASNAWGANSTMRRARKRDLTRFSMWSMTSCGRVCVCGVKA
eukprot:365348-Chlamydomonas_euryale.AAC.1